MKKTLWIMVGAPGCGKSWVAKNILMRGAGWQYISRDDVRFSIITDEDEYFEKENLVFSRFVQMISSALNDTDTFNVIADATHLNWASRYKLLNALGQKFKKIYDIIPVVVNAPIQEVLSNNEERSGRSCVPCSVVRRMYSKMSDPKTDPYHYTGIMYIDNTRTKEK